MIRSHIGKRKNISVCEKYTVFLGFYAGITIIFIEIDFYRMKNRFYNGGKKVEQN